MNDLSMKTLSKARVTLSAAGSHPALTRYGAPAISMAVLVSALFELHAMDWQAVVALVPVSPLFWAVFLLAYATPIVADWLIYRGLWNIPAAGLLPMLRKMVGNDLLIGYAGEAYLYTYARREGQDGGTAFRALKDVSILSAAVGGGMTLLAALLTAPILGRLDLGLPTFAIVGIAVLIAAPPAAALFLRNRLFHLPSAQLVRIAIIHAVRAAIGIALTAVVWHLALPALALSWWLIFSAMKLLLSRLPLVSNKELVFAGAVAAVMGGSGEVAALMAMMASITVAAHVLMGLAASSSDVLGRLAARVAGGEIAAEPVPVRIAR